MVDNMEWFNVFGLIFIAVIMIPNVVFAIKCKDGFDNKWNNKYVEVTEQVGRLGCFGFMIINIPGTWFGWWSDETFAVYLIVLHPILWRQSKVVKLKLKLRKHYLTSSINSCFYIDLFVKYP